MLSYMLASYVLQNHNIVCLQLHSKQEKSRRNWFSHYGYSINGVMKSLNQNTNVRYSTFIFQTSENPETLIFCAHMSFYNYTRTS